MPPDTGDDMDLPQTKRRALRFLGRRGMFLLASGVLFITYGVGFWTRPLPSSPFADAIFHENIPYRIRAALWIAFGVLAIVTAFVRTPGRDSIGFIGLIIMPTLRMASYSFAYLVYLVPGPGLGESRAWITAVFYAWLVFVILHAARDPQPQPHPPNAHQEATSPGEAA